MIVKFKKNITVNNIQYLQGTEYNISQKEFEFVSVHVDVIEQDKKPEVQETVKNKIVNRIKQSEKQSEKIESKPNTYDKNLKQKIIDLGELEIIK